VGRDGGCGCGGLSFYSEQKIEVIMKRSKLYLIKSKIKKIKK
jgi:hypothetical protein